MLALRQRTMLLSVFHGDTADAHVRRERKFNGSSFTAPEGIYPLLTLSRAHRGVNHNHLVVLCYVDFSEFTLCGTKVFSLD